MMRGAMIVAMVATVIIGSSTPSLADTELTGERKGAFFRIVVPDNWDGGLVIWNHGFLLEPEEPVDLGPFKDLWLSEGFAVAASSYRQIGWALFQTKKDLKSLIRIFKKNFGEPNQIFITGASLGGIVTAQAIEKLRRKGKRKGNIVGALSLCGSVAGSRNWDAALDLRLIYDTVCRGVPGAFIPGGPEGLPEESNLDFAEIALAVNQCTGVLVPPPLRTPDQTDRLATILKATTIPNEEFLLRDMRLATLGLGDLTHDKRKLKGKKGVGNEGAFYSDPEINAEIERVEPDKKAAKRLFKNYTPTGKVRGVKIVSLHTDQDGQVIVENETEYAKVVPAENLTTAIVREDTPTHCGFTDAEGAAGWESLRSWVGGGPQPSAFSIRATCDFLQASGSFTGPCRIDPFFALPEFDDRIPPRGQADEDEDDDDDDDDDD